MNFKMALKLMYIICICISMHYFQISTKRPNLCFSHLLIWKKRWINKRLDILCSLLMFFTCRDRLIINHKSLVDSRDTYLTDWYNRLSDDNLLICVNIFHCAHPVQLCTPTNIEIYIIETCFKTILRGSPSFLFNLIILHI